MPLINTVISRQVMLSCVFLGKQCFSQLCLHCWLQNTINSALHHETFAETGVSFNLKDRITQLLKKYYPYKDYK